MNANPFLGVILHMLGGLAAASFYVPCRGIRRWAWESYWITLGFFGWIVMPWVLALITTPNVWAVFSESSLTNISWCYIFGVMWGIGALTFGLTMRYLGIALGVAVALGFCAAFGTLMPPIFDGSIGEIIRSQGGVFILLGVAMCLAGIGVSGWAGMHKDRELTDEQKAETIVEFDFPKGIIVATIAGVFSAGMAYGVAAGKPIADLAFDLGTDDLWKNTPVFILVMAGGFTTNVIWCVYLNFKNRSSGNYIDGTTPLLRNYALCALAGCTWYLQFMFYGMGTTQMGRYDFSSWSLHMASIIVFSTLWGIALHEWKGSSRRTFAMVALGMAILVGSIVIVGYGNTLVAAPSR